MIILKSNFKMTMKSVRIVRLVYKDSLLRSLVTGTGGRVRFAFDRGGSSIGRALPLHGRGYRFESDPLHILSFRLPHGKKEMSLAEG
jgi:hypothetical protein